MQSTFFRRLVVFFLVITTQSAPKSQTPPLLCITGICTCESGVTPNAPPDTTRIQTQCSHIVGESATIKAASQLLWQSPRVDENPQHISLSIFLVDCGITSSCMSVTLLFLYSTYLHHPRSPPLFPFFFCQYFSTEKFLKYSQ